MAEKSKEKKRSGAATLVATALAVLVGGVALWSINRSISDPDLAGTGTFPADTRVAAQHPATKSPEVQENLIIAPPPNRIIVTDVKRAPPLARSPLPARSVPTITASVQAADTTAVEVDPDAEMREDATEEADTLASITTAAGSAPMAAKDTQDETATAEPDIAAAEKPPVPGDPQLNAGSSYYIAIGSYIHRGNALLVMRERQTWHPQIREAMVDGRHFYRLVVGPFSLKDLTPARTRMHKAGVVGEWPIRAGSDTKRADLALLD